MTTSAALDCIAIFPVRTASVANNLHTSRAQIQQQENRVMFQTKSGVNQIRIVAIQIHSAQGLFAM